MDNICNIWSPSGIELVISDRLMHLHAKRNCLSYTLCLQGLFVLHIAQLINGTDLHYYPISVLSGH